MLAVVGPQNAVQRALCGPTQCSFLPKVGLETRLHSGGCVRPLLLGWEMQSRPRRGLESVGVGMGAGWFVYSPPSTCKFRVCSAEGASRLSCLPQLPSPAVSNQQMP